MKINFNEEKHKYSTSDGVILPSVTQICGMFNYEISQNANPYLRDQAAAKGSAIHQATMMLDFGENVGDDFPEEWLGYIDAYNRFKEDFSPVWYGIEKPIGLSKESADRLKFIQYAGTIDRFGKIAGQNVVLDIKTGTSLHFPYVSAQLKAYDILLAFEENFMSERQLVLQLGKNGMYKLFETTFCPPFLEIAMQYQKEKNYKGAQI